MNAASDTAFLVTGLLIGGVGLIFLSADRASHASRALSVCLVAIGLSLFLIIFARTPGREMVLGSLEAVAILAGVEWGRRIGLTATSRYKAGALWLFRAAQLIVLVFWLLNLGYIAIWPERAITDAPGVVSVRAVEFAVFAPILGSAMLCATIAIVMLRFMRIDQAERVRLRALLLAGPFLLAGLVVADALVPLTLAVGLLIFLYGSVRYLIIQGERGQIMSRFLSPEVARMVRAEGMDRVLQRQRRPLSVVVCDLRGFTAYARTHDSDAVATLLERFYAVVGAAAAVHGATIKDHAGDGVLILVGAPLPVPDHARRAALLALELMARGRALLQESAAGLGLGIGVATGDTTVGAIRGAGRLEYVAIGNAVNLAARLCARAEDGEILADHRTSGELGTKDNVTSTERPSEHLKGFAEPVAVRALSGRPDLAPAR